MPTIHVAVLDDYQRRAHEFADWNVLGQDVEVRYFHDTMRGDALVSALREFEVLALIRERTAFSREVLEQLPSLRLLVTTGMRNASVDTAYLKERGITVSGTEGGGNSTGELAWSLIFSLVKRVPFEDRALREGLWQTKVPTDLSGTTLGLVGLGRLGSGMVAPARVFGMNVVAWSTNLTPERAREVGVSYVSKEELFSTSDVISIHLVLSDRSRGLIGAEDLARMKSSAYLVNTSRGPIVDEAALIDALECRSIAGAGLDVYDIEPLPSDHRFLTLDNTVLTPHLGYVSEATFKIMYGQIVEDIASFLEGSPVRVVE